MKTIGKPYNWIRKQQKDVGKVFAPKMHYDKEFDIFCITWCPQFKVKYSLETEDGFVFDMARHKQEEVVGIEIMDFMKKLKIKQKDICVELGKSFVKGYEKAKHDEQERILKIIKSYKIQLIMNSASNNLLQKIMEEIKVRKKVGK